MSLCLTHEKGRKLSMAKNDTPKSVRCSFCGKAQENVKKIVAGPRGIYL